MQRVIPDLLQQAILLHASDLTLAGHLRWRRRYDTVRRLFYHPYLAKNVYTYVEKSVYFHIHGRHPTPQRLLKLSQPEILLDFIALDVLGPLLKTEAGSIYTAVIAIRFLKLGRVIPTKRRTAVQVVSILLGAWISLYVITDRILTDNGP